MKILPLIMTCAAGLAAGALLGRIGPSGVSDARRASSGSAREQMSDDRFRAFAENDATAVRVFSALQHPMYLRMRFELFEASRDLTAHNLPALVTRAQTLPSAPRSELLPMLLERWFELDFQAAHTWMRAHPKEFAARAAFARVNPEAAIQEALQLSDTNRARVLLHDAIRQLAGNDLEAQAARLKALPRGKLRDTVLQGVLSGWALRQNPTAAFAALGEISPGSARDNARNAALLAWAHRDPVGALQQVNAILPTLRAGVLGNDLVTNIAEAIVNKDPRLAFEWISQLPAEFRAAPAIAAARSWAAKEPVAALDWCIANEVDVVRGRRFDLEQSLPGVLGEAMAAAPAATTAWLQALPAGPDRDRLIERGLTTGLLRAKDQLMTGDNGFAMRLFDDLPADGQVRTANRLGQSRAQQGNLNDLQGWAANFAPGEARVNAVAGAVGATYERNPSQIDGLLASTTIAADRDAGLRGLATAMSNTLPKDAAMRALTIGDTALRQETLGDVITAWQKRDPTATREWLQSVDTIPAAWKETWLKPR